MKRTPLRRFGARRERELPDLEAFREAVLHRAQGRCERCGDRDRLDPHHMLPRASNHPLRHHPDLGAGLCRSCHNHIHHKKTSHDWKLWVVTTAQLERALKDEKPLGEFRLRAQQALGPPPTALPKNTNKSWKGT